MKITNVHNIPERIVRLLPKTFPLKKDRIGVTSLIDAPRVRTLMLEKWDDLIIDCSDSLFSVFGISLDERVNRYTEDDEESQVKHEDKVDGITVVGKADIYIPEKYQIIDTKVCGVDTLAFKDTLQKWEKQQNTYAWQHRKRDKEVKELIIDCFFRDWKLSRAKVVKGYPSILYKEIKLPLWSFEEQEDYVKSQVEFHQMNPMACSDTDRWKKDDQYAVMEKGKKKALAANKYIDGGSERIPFTRQDAIDWINRKGYQDKKGVYIEERKGACIRCDSYCRVRSVCDKGD